MDFQGATLSSDTGFLLLREFYMKDEEVKRFIAWLIRRLVKAASRISCHGRYWRVHVASAFPLAHHNQAVLGHG
jgi:hypothetical protein